MKSIVFLSILMSSVVCYSDEPITAELIKKGEEVCKTFGGLVLITSFPVVTCKNGIEIIHFENLDKPKKE